MLNLVLLPYSPNRLVPLYTGLLSFANFEHFPPPRAFAITVPSARNAFPFTPWLVPFILQISA